MQGATSTPLTGLSEGLLVPEALSISGPMAAQHGDPRASALLVQNKALEVSLDGPKALVSRARLELSAFCHLTCEPLHSFCIPTHTHR